MHELNHVSFVYTQYKLRKMKKYVLRERAIYYVPLCSILLSNIICSLYCKYVCKKCVTPVYSSVNSMQNL